MPTFDRELRLEALKFATQNGNSGLAPAVQLTAAVAFYDFLSSKPRNVKKAIRAGEKAIKPRKK